MMMTTMVMMTATMTMMMMATITMTTMKMMTATMTMLTMMTITMTTKSRMVRFTHLSPAVALLVQVPPSAEAIVHTPFIIIIIKQAPALERNRRIKGAVSLVRQ